MRAVPGSATPRTLIWVTLTGVIVLAVAVLAYVLKVEKRGGKEEVQPDAAAAFAPTPVGGGSAEAVPDIPDDDVVPHPFFPTAAAAGTAQLFDAAEPSVSPVNLAVTLPRRDSLRWGRYAFCEVEHGGLTCGPQARKQETEGAHWRVGRGARGGKERGDAARRSAATNVAERLILAERRVGEVVHQTVLVRLDRRGRLVTVTSLDAYDEVVWVRSYDPPGKRYSARKRTGANELEGCGYLELAGDGPDETTCLQWLLKPMKDKTGVAIRSLRRDARGFVVEERRRGVDRLPLAGNDGIHRVVIRRDPVGRPVATRGYDLAGKPARSGRTGCHGEARTRDRRGLVVERRCLGVDGRPAPDRSEVAIKRHEYDSRGCLVATSHFDPDGRAVPNADGVQTERFARDRRCAVLQRSCHHEGRVPCGPHQPAELRFKVDAKGRMVSARHYGVSRGPGRDPEYGVFELRYSYDDRGNRIAESCFDSAGSPVECDSTGFQRVQSRYDSAGHKIEDRFFDADGSAATNLGTALRRFRYDSYNHLHSTRDLDGDGQPVESLGSASRRYLYDEDHQLFGMVLFDREGRPAAFNGCITGHSCPRRSWHAMRVVRTAKGRAVRNLFFDGDRRLIHRTDCRNAQCWK
jgi:hypothetical protein